MDMKNVPAEIHDIIEGLKQGSYNVEAYVTEAIDQAENWGVAKGEIMCRMIAIIREADCVLGDLCGKQSEIDMENGGDVNITLRSSELATILAGIKEIEKNHDRASIVMAHKEFFWNVLPLDTEGVTRLFEKLWNRGKQLLQGKK
jgi:hypothetical protein